MPKDILQLLQSRIDSTAHRITEDILYGDFHHPFVKAQKKQIEDRQALDKRLMGEIVMLRRLAKYYKELNYRD